MIKIKKRCAVEMMFVSTNIVIVAFGCLVVPGLCNTTASSFVNNGTFSDSNTDTSPTSTINYSITTGSNTAVTTGPVVTETNASSAPYVTETTVNSTDASNTIETSVASMNSTTVSETTVNPLTFSTVGTTVVHSKTTHSHSVKVKSGFSGLAFGIGILSGVTITLLSILLVFVYRKRFPYEQLQDMSSTASINFMKDP